MTRLLTPLVALLLAAPVFGYTADVFHISLRRSVPAANDTLTAAPSSLVLEFSGFIERTYTSVTLHGPDGTQVPLGSIAWSDTNAGEFSAAMPPLSIGGEYTVRWRTAGADGHILNGEFTFFMDLPDAPPPAPADSATGGVASLPPADDHAHDDGHDHGGGEHDATAPIEVLARLLHFVALMLLAGALALRVLVLPRLAARTGVAAGDPLYEEIARRAWRGVLLGAVILAVAAIGRLYLQSAAMHGAERAFSIPLLSIMLADTRWGRGWMFQAAAFGLLGIAIAFARPRRDGIALALALPAVIMLAAVPGLTGHAAGAASGAIAAVANDTLHVLAVGAWMGTLALIMISALPAITRAAPDAARTQADLVDTFSPLALGAAGVGVITGVINSLMHLDAVPQLWQTAYGQALLLKVALVLLVTAGGFVNWRVVRPRLAAGDVARLRIVASSELLFALLVLLVTAVLTGLPRP